MPPPLTGGSVRVPRNKLFVQQLPLPLIALSQVRNNESAYRQKEAVFFSSLCMRWCFGSMVYFFQCCALFGWLEDVCADCPIRVTAV